MKPRIFVPRLVPGSNEHYKIHTDNFGTMLCGDQLDQEFIKIEVFNNLVNVLRQLFDFTEALCDEKKVSKDYFSIGQAREVLREIDYMGEAK